MDKVIDYIENNREKFVDRLRQNVEIASVSGWPSHRQQCIDQMEAARKLLENLNFHVER